jgi:hypothetical protein
MRYRNYKTKNKFYPSNYNRKSKRNKKYKDEMESAFQDEFELKKKKKRLTIDWFFRPKGD